MSPQRHDPGYRKRLRRERAASDPTPAPTSPDSMARDLVRRGLAARLILDPFTRPPRGARRPRTDKEQTR